MKNIKYLLFIFVSIFFSCTKGDVVVTGNAGVEIPEGETVYLMTVGIDGQAVILDSARVHNEKFELSAAVPSPTICNVVTFSGGKVKKKIDFVAEGDNVIITLTDKRHIVSGSPLNDELQRYSDTLAIVKQLYKRYALRKQKEELSVKAQDEADDVMAVTAVYHRDYLGRVIERNIDNLLAPYFLKNNIGILEAEQALSLIERLPADARKDATMQYAEKYYRAVSNCAVGRQFSDFIQKNRDGDDVSLSSIAGREKSVIISFWSSRNKNSIRKIVELDSVAGRFSENATLIGISIDTDYDAWCNAIEKNNLGALQLTDLKGWNNAVLSIYGVDKIPYNIVINKLGEIVLRDATNDEILKYLSE